MVASNNVEFVLSGLRQPTSKQLTRVGVANHGSLVALLDGSASNHDWDILCAALNISLVLAEGGIGDDFITDIKRGLTALEAVGKRWVTWNKWQVTSAEQGDLVYALEVHDKQLLCTLVKTIELAQNEVNRRLRAGKIAYCVKPAKGKSKPQAEYDELQEVGLC